MLSVTSVMRLIGFFMVRPIASGSVLHPSAHLDVSKHLNGAGKFIRFCMFELSRVVPRIELNIEAGRDAAYTAALNVLDADKEHLFEARIIGLQSDRQCGAGNPACSRLSSRPVPDLERSGAARIGCPTSDSKLSP